jgi:hypothetical protein
VGGAGNDRTRGRYATDPATFPVRCADSAGCAGPADRRLGGPDKLLLSCILYAPGAILYVIARRERDLRLFRPAEAVLFGIIVLGAIAGVGALVTGAIEI